MGLVVAETHSHTIACSHAYSTIYENARACKEKEIAFLCVTEHGPAMVDGPHEWFFGNIRKVVPRVLDGVTILYGAESNIIDFRGTLDICDEYLSKLDWVIASYHTVCIEPATIKEHTEGWLAVAENPLVDVIGHAGDARFAFEIEPVVAAFAKHGKIVEINAHSFECRPGSTENCRKIAQMCKKYGVRVVCSSDAHFFTGIGRVQPALDMLREIDFPEELILNTDYDRFHRVVQEKCCKNTHKKAGGRV